MISLFSAVHELAVVPIIGILRQFPLDSAAIAGRLAARAGIPAIEITMDGPGALDQIELLAAEGISVGAGSVLTPTQIRDAHRAGARFTASPVLMKDVVWESARVDLAHVPGAMTPTEIAAALRLGISEVKVFPIHLLGGEAYLRAVRAPLHDPQLIPTGGIGALNAVGFLRAGAAAVGVGSAVFDSTSNPQRIEAELPGAVAKLVDSARKVAS